MTTRERKYHKRKWWNRWLRRMMKLKPNELMAEQAKVRKRLYSHFDKEKGVIDLPLPGPPVTITLTKYNLPNNSNLQKGQLN